MTQGLAPASALLLTALCGTLLRLELAYFTYGNYDMDSWRIVAGIVSGGGNVYAETTRYAYSPIWFAVLGLLERVRSVFPFLPFHFLVKAFLTFTDLLSMVFIALISQRRKISPAVPAALFYLNPISILLTGVHGHFDSAAIVPLLAGIAACLRYGGASSAGKAALWLGSSLGMWIKHSLFFEPILCVNASVKSWWVKAALLAGTVAGFLLLFLPYWVEGKEGILRLLFHITPPPRRYGVALFFPGWAMYKAPFLAAACLFPLMIRKKDLLSQCLLGMLFFLVFTPIIGIQYFVLPVALGALRPSKWFFLYTLIGTLFILGSPVNLHVLWLAFVRGNYLWAVAAVWFVAELKRPVDPSCRLI